MDKQERKLIKRVVRTTNEISMNPQNGVLRIMDAEERARDARDEVRHLRNANKRLAAILGVVTARMLGITGRGDLGGNTPSLSLEKEDFAAMDGVVVRVCYEDKESEKPYPVTLTILDEEIARHEQMNEQLNSIPEPLRGSFERLFRSAGMCDASDNGSD